MSDCDNDNFSKTPIPISKVVESTSSNKNIQTVIVTNNETVIHDITFGEQTNF